MGKIVSTGKDAAKLMAELDKAQAEFKLNEETLIKELSPVQLKLEQIKLKKDGRALAGKKRAAKNRARKLKKLRDRRYDAKRRLVRWTAVNDGDWWPQVRRVWTQKSYPVKLTEKQWKTIIQPCIPQGPLIVVHRYDTKGPISLDNIYITESGTSSVLWDGKEWKLKQKGYAL